MSVGTRCYGPRVIEEWGRAGDETPVHVLVLGSEPGVVLHLLTLGSTVHRLEVTGGDGVRRNVALGHATPADYLASTAYLGATVGRYANRIAAGRFTLDGRPVEVGTNDRGNHLHGGPDGFDKRVWEVEAHDERSAVLRLVSPDGDQGYPGRLEARAAWTVEGDTVSLVLTATTDAPTVVNLTQHGYLNLDGEGAGTVDAHLLQVLADEYTPVDETGIPLGEHAPVAGTGFDLREPRLVGEAVRSADDQITTARGIDHSYLLRGEGLRPVAVVTSPATRTQVTLASDQPALQVYTGNFLDGSEPSTTGRLYRQGDGLALEPQLPPDTPNRPGWQPATLTPGETYRSEMTWQFAAADTWETDRR